MNTGEFVVVFAISVFGVYFAIFTGYILTDIYLSKFKKKNRKVRSS